MKLLAIETAVTPGSLAIVKTAGDSPPRRLEEDLPTDSRTAQSLAPAMAAMLDRLGWSATDLDLVAASVGPGSFTGLRIGVTAAKTLAYAAGARCVAVGTLAVIAHQARRHAPSANGWAVLDAQRAQLFAARLSAPHETTIVDKEAWLGSLREGEVVAGPILEKLAERLPPGVVTAPESAWRPHAEIVAELALSAADSVSPFELMPIYGRLSAAEEKLAEKEAGEA
ncbi:MAG: tRNA (adenosine(37)-N6)-threonylcarbamoyltransferase complex dimerization subunit type 1 TsaB [Planctomycetota bacterium]